MFVILKCVILYTAEFVCYMFGFAAGCLATGVSVRLPVGWGSRPSWHTARRRGRWGRRFTCRTTSVCATCTPSLSTSGCVKTPVAVLSGPPVHGVRYTELTLIRRDSLKQSIGVWCVWCVWCVCVVWCVVCVWCVCV